VSEPEDPDQLSEPFSDPAVEEPPLSDDEVFIVAGLGASAGDDLGDSSQLASLVGGPEAGVDDATMAALARAGLEEVELSADPGGPVAVVPPAEALEGTDEAAPLELEEELPETPTESEATPAPRPRRFLVPVAAAAVALLGVGIAAYFLRPAPEPVTAPVVVAPKRATPVPKPAPIVPDADGVLLAAAAPVVAPAPVGIPALSGNPDAIPGMTDDHMGLAFAPAAPEETVSAAPSHVAEPWLASVNRGADVVVRLRNGNYFGGKLTRYAVESARIKVEKGEIDLPMSDVEAIVPLTQVPKNEGPEAVLRLANGNRIAGRLAENGEEEVSLSLGPARIKVPRAVIVAVELRPATGVILEQPGLHP